MRRATFFLLGVIELAMAGTVVYLSLLLPSSHDVRQTMEEVKAITHQTGQQVELAKKEIETVRHPEVRQLVENLQTELPQITALLRNQKLNYASVRQMKDALGDIAKGLQTVSTTLDPNGIQKISQGLKQTADYFEKEVGPAAGSAADRLEKTLMMMASDAEAISALLKEVAPDLKGAKEMHDSLGRLDAGLDKVSLLIDTKRMATMRDGFKGIESSLSLGSQQVGRLANFTYPNVTFNGFRPQVVQKPFWPQGRQIAAGMAQGAKGVRAAGEQLDALAKDIPQLTQAIQESQRAARSARDTLAKALKNQDRFEKVLKEIPENSGRLAREVLPALGKDLSRILRETEKLKAVAVSIRETQKGIDASAKSWPDLKVALSRSAEILTTTQSQLDIALANEETHKKALRHTLEMTDGLGRLLPLVTKQLDNQLGQQSQSLDRLRESLSKAEHHAPRLAEGASKILDTVRWLLWLFASLVAIHGIYFCVDSTRARNEA